MSRCGADHARVARALEAVRAARAAGKPVELLDTLVAQRILTRSQAEALRASLEATPPPFPADLAATQNGRPSEQTAVTPTPGANGAAESIPPTSSGHYLRSVGEYRLLRRLGQGGMGSVYLAYEEGGSRPVAIKVLSDQLANDSAYVERFYREARSGAALDHPNIVRFFKAGQDAPTGKHYLVLEYVDGVSAQALLERLGRLSVGDAVHLILDVARALEHAHSRSFVHRDIKPDNILITRSGVAKLADLGLAKRVDEASHLTALRQGFGSLFYIPYEQAFNAKEADGRGDIYALGATLYHLLTGEVPFPGKSHLEIAERKLAGTFTSASQLNTAVPPVLDRILEKMLARDADDRYQLVSELIVELERANIAATVPSFADAALALNDPLVQARLATAQPTQLDLHEKLGPAATVPATIDSWYVRFRNGDGRWCKTKMNTEQVIQRIADGRIAPDAEACRQPQGEFRPLADVPEFGEAAVSAPPLREENHDADLSPPPAAVHFSRWSRSARIGAFLGALGLLGGLAAGLYRLFLAP